MGYCDFDYSIMLLSSLSDFMSILSVECQHLVIEPRLDTGHCDTGHKCSQEHAAEESRPCYHGFTVRRRKPKKKERERERETERDREKERKGERKKERERERERDRRERERQREREIVARERYEIKQVCFAIAGHG